MDQPPAESTHRSHVSVGASGKARNRSQSTTSVNSGVTRNKWYENRQTHPIQSLSGHMTAEDMVMQSANQLQNPQGYELDPQLTGATNHQMAYQRELHCRPGSAQRGAAYEGYPGGFVDGDNQLIEARSDEQDDVDSVAGSGVVGKKVAKTSAANELEMRELYRSNAHRSLPDVAAELHGNERGPQSERQRQVFAMLWINHVCQKGKGSVPRGRVYASYVSRCAKERVTVLNPASFGKLVRVLHPGLKTRRLGQRGESKYHYVGFILGDDQRPATPLRAEQQAQIYGQQPPVNQQGISIMLQTQFPADRAVFPAPTLARIPKQRCQGLGTSHSLYKQPEIYDVSNLDSTTAKMRLRLRFPGPEELVFQEGESIQLPNIDSFLPTGTDSDSAQALFALYLSHCTSVVECMRFCKEKTFFHLFTSFHGTLTMPVQKLFSKPEIAPWIEECDFVMYQRMMRVVAPLTLQVAPKQVLDTLRNISSQLVRHIQNSFQGHPSYVIDAKVAPATLFAGLLDRELRVNLTAHAAANMLSNPYNRDTMYEDWIKMVRTRKVAEGVPTRAMDEVVNIFLTEIRDLLEPQNVSWELEGVTAYGEMAQHTGRRQQIDVHADSTTEDILDRWVTFLGSLPARFPYASPAEIVWCVQRVGTDALRDLTLAQGQSFGAWWVTKCWVDEMICFKAEQGGFMDCKTSRVSKRAEASSQPAFSTEVSEHGSRYSSASEGFITENSNGEISTTVPRAMDITTQAAINVAAGLDDSGISMPSTEDDFHIPKYTLADDEPHAQMRSNGLSNAITQPVA